MILTTEQITKLESFVESIPETMVKSQVQVLVNEVKKDSTITTEEVEKLKSFATHLPKELQSFPQEFSMEIKNGVGDVVEATKKEKTIAKKEAPKKSGSKK